MVALTNSFGNLPTIEKGGRRSRQRGWEALCGTHNQLRVRASRNPLEIQGYPFNPEQLEAMGPVEVVLLRAGLSELPMDLPFVRHGRWLTNGHLTIPYEVGGDPNRTIQVEGIGKVPVGLWPDLIRLLEGRPLRIHVVKQSTGVKAKSVNNAESTSRRNGDSRMVQAMIEADRLHHDHQISDLQVAPRTCRFTYSLRSDCGKKVWVVRCLGRRGAIYLFLSEEEATRWMRGDDQFRQARRNGVCIVHQGAWRSRLNDHIEYFLG